MADITTKGIKFDGLPATLGNNLTVTGGQILTPSGVNLALNPNTGTVTVGGIIQCSGTGTSSFVGNVTMIKAGSGDESLTIKTTTGGDPTIIFDSAAVNRSGILRFQDNGAHIGRIQYNHSGDTLHLQAGSSTGYALEVANSTSTFSGKVGTGGHTPDVGLEVYGADNTNAKIKITNTATDPDNIWSIHAAYNAQDLIFTGDSQTVLTLHDSGAATFAGNVEIAGDLEVTGITTTTNVVNLDLQDNIIGLNRGTTSSTNDAGIIIERGSTGDNAAILWDESADHYVFGLTTANPAATGNIALSTFVGVKAGAGEFYSDVTAHGESRKIRILNAGSAEAVQLLSDGSGDGQLRLNNSGGTTQVLLYGEANADQYIDNGGDLGIGTKTPSKKLDVHTNTNTDGIRLQGTATNLALIINQTGSNGVAWNIAGTGGGHGYGDGSLQFGIGFGVPKVTFKSDGKVGIGTYAPFSALSINSNGVPIFTAANMATTGLTIHNGTGGTAIQIGTYDAGAYNYIQSGYINSASTARELRFYNGSVNSLKLSTTGAATFVGAVSATTFTGALTGTASNAALLDNIDSNQFAQYHNLTFVDGTERVIRTTTFPTASRTSNPDPEDYDRLFHTEFKQRSVVGSPLTGSCYWAGVISIAPYAGGASWYTTQISLGADGTDADLYVRRGAGSTWGSWRQIITADSATFTGEVDVPHGKISILGGNNLTISGTASNHAGLSFGTNIIYPATAAGTNDNTFDLGDPDERFKDAYFGGTVSAGAVTASDTITSSKSTNAGIGGQLKLINPHNSDNVNEIVFEHRGSGTAVSKIESVSTDGGNNTKLLLRTENASTIATRLTLDEDGDATFTGDVTVHKDAPKFILKDTGTGNAMTSEYAFQDGNGVSRGYLGYGSSGNSVMYLQNTLSEIHFHTSSGLCQTLSGTNTTFAGNLTTSGYIGRDGHNYITFATDNEIITRVADTHRTRMTTAALEPYADVAYNLGASGKRFNFLHINNTIYLSDGNMVSNGANPWDFNGVLRTSVGSPISYIAGDEIVAAHEHEERQVDSNANYKRMAAITVSRSGTASVKWEGYISSGTYYWSWVIAKNNGTSTDLSAPGGILKTGNFQSASPNGLASGVSASVHAYRQFDVDIGGMGGNSATIMPGDQIELWMRSSGGDGSVATGNGQTLYAKKFRISASTPTVESNAVFHGTTTISDVAGDERYGGESWSKYLTLDAADSGGGGIVWSKQSGTYNRGILANHGDLQLVRSTDDGNNGSIIKDLVISNTGDAAFGGKVAVGGASQVTNSGVLDVQLDTTNGMLAAASSAHFGKHGANTSGEISGITLGYKENANANYRKLAIAAAGRGDGAARQDLHLLVNTQNGSNSASLADSKMKIDGLNGSVIFSTDVTVNTGLYPDANDGAQLGNSSLTFSDAHIGQITIDDYIYHKGDTDTYMYFQDNNISFNTGGGNRFQISNNRVQANEPFKGIHVGSGTTIVRPGSTAMWAQSGNSTGRIEIRLPGQVIANSTHNYGMVYLQIDVYEYTSAGPTTYFVGGHNWDSSTNAGNWHQYNAQKIGHGSKHLHLGIRNQRYCIIIGEADSTWAYSSVHVSYANNAAFYGSAMDMLDDGDYGWSIGQVTHVNGDYTNFKQSLTGTIQFNDSDLQAKGGTFSGNATLNGAETIFNPDGDSQAKIKNVGTNAIALFAGSGDTLYLGGNDTTGVYLDASANATFMGSVGASGDLVLKSDGVSCLTLWDSGGAGLAKVHGSLLIPGKLEHDGDTNTYFNFSANDHIELVAGGTEFLAIDGTNLTLSPSGTLTIDAGGQVNIDSGNSEIHLKGSGTTFGKLYTSGGDFYINHPTSDEDIIIRGNDGGSSINALTFDMSDGGRAIFNNDVIAFSDKKLKKNIKTLDGSKVYDMRGVSFTRKDTDKKGSGVIAQEMEKVAPELVTKTNDTLGVSYGNLTGYLIEAIKDLKAEVEELKQCNKCEDCNCKNE